LAQTLNLKDNGIHLAKLIYHKDIDGSPRDQLVVNFLFNLVEFGSRLAHNFLFNLIFRGISLVPKQFLSNLQRY